MNENTAASAAPILLADQLRKSHPGGETGPQIVLDGVNLRVFPGEATGILGASGSGKTTLLHLLGGLDAPDSGAAAVAGKKWADMRPDEAAAWRNIYLGFVFQFHLLLPEFTALENAAMPLLLRRTPRDEAMTRAEKILTELGLGPHLNKTPDKLSGGERQRTAVARALTGEPKCILADEPTGNLDRRNAEGVFSMLLAACRERGAALIVATHDDRLSAALPRRLILSDGKLQEEQEAL